MRAIITGGGTGGHIYPALAIAKGLKERYPGIEILYVGTDRGLESDIVPKEGYPFEKINVAGFKRSLSPKNIKILWQAGEGLLQALRIVRRFKPDIAVGTGGYVTGPVMMACAVQKVPTVIHEQNALPGVTNRILSRMVSRVAVTFEDSIARFPKQARIKLTGLPVRPEIFDVQKEEAYLRLGIKPKKPVLLVFGGSRGARKINTAMVKVVEELQHEEVQVIHATGQIGHQEYLEMLHAKGISLVNIGNITTVPYLYNMKDALAVADLVVCRAGAATLAEITALGLPGILVPYPYAAENHQEYNARALAERNAAVLINDGDLTGEVLLGQIKRLLSSPETLHNMAEESLKLGKPQALNDILDLIAELLNR